MDRGLDSFQGLCHWHGSGDDDDDDQTEGRWALKMKRVGDTTAAWSHRAPQAHGAEASGDPSGATGCPSPRSRTRFFRRLDLSLWQPVPMHSAHWPAEQG